MESNEPVKKQPQKRCNEPIGVCKPTKGRSKKIIKGPSGGAFYMKKGKKVYVKRDGRYVKGALNNNK